jgi:hypothetical protein
VNEVSVASVLVLDGLTETLKLETGAIEVGMGEVKFTAEFVFDGLLGGALGPEEGPTLE